MARSSTTIKPGERKNPLGGKRAKAKEFRAAAQAYLEACRGTDAEGKETKKNLFFAVCDEILFGQKENVTKDGDIVLTRHDAKDRIKVIENLRDDAYGKPTQRVEITGEDGGPVETVQVYVPDNGR